MSYENYLTVFNQQIPELTIKYGYVPDLFSESEQETIQKTKILYPLGFKTKKIEGEEPEQTQINKALKEFVALKNLLGTRHRQAIEKPDGSVMYKPMPLKIKYKTDDILNAEYDRCLVESKQVSYIKKGAKFLGVVLNDGKKFWYAV